MVSYLPVLEVFDDVQLVFLQHVVVRVQLLILLLKVGQLSSQLLCGSFVDLELLSHILKFFLLTHPDVPHLFHMLFLFEIISAY